MPQRGVDRRTRLTGVRMNNKMVWSEMQKPDLPISQWPTVRFEKYHDGYMMIVEPRNGTDSVPRMVFYMRQICMENMIDEGQAILSGVTPYLK